MTVTATVNQLSAIDQAIMEEYRIETANMDFATRMATSNTSARQRAFNRFPQAVVDAYLALEREDDRRNAAASDTKGTY